MWRQFLKENYDKIKHIVWKEVCRCFNQRAGAEGGFAPLDEEGQIPVIYLENVSSGGGGGIGNPLDDTFTANSFVVPYDESISKKITFNAEHPSVAPGAIWYSEHDVNDDGTYNNVLSMGLNFDQTKAGYGYIRWGLEGNYQPYDGAPFRWFEAHLPEVQLLDGTIYRPASWEGRKDARSGTWNYRASNYIFNRADADNVLMSFNSDGNFVMRGYEASSATWMLDNNADGSRLAVQANSDTISFTANYGTGIFDFKGTRVNISNTNGGVYPFIVNTNNANNVRGLYHTGSVSANALLFEGEVSAPGLYYAEIKNTHATGAAQINVTSNGIPAINLTKQGTDASFWTFGNIGNYCYFNNGTVTGFAIFNDGSIYFGAAPEHVDNAAAVAAGLGNGRVYRTGDNLKIVHA